MTGTATVTVNSFADSAAIDRPGINGKYRGMAGGVFLAFLFFLGVPARRRKLRLTLGALALMATLGSLIACGGNFTQSNPTGKNTTAGNYTFTVTGIGNPSVSPAPTTTFVLTVR
jgi:hypothetical protein